MNPDTHHVVSIRRIIGEIEVDYSALVTLKNPQPESLTRALDYIVQNEAGDPDEATFVEGWHEGRGMVLNGDGTGTRITGTARVTSAEFEVLKQHLPALNFSDNANEEAA